MILSLAAISACVPDYNFRKTLHDTIVINIFQIPYHNRYVCIICSYRKFYDTWANPRKRIVHRYIKYFFSFCCRTLTYVPQRTIVSTNTLNAVLKCTIQEILGALVKMVMIIFCNVLLLSACYGIMMLCNCNSMAKFF